MDSNKPRFAVHPSVVYQLGESLITDSIQALIELVKNCYDADATYAKVTIDTKGNINVPNTIFSSKGSRIIVEDDGHGMDLETITSGWLLISNRKKRDLTEAKGTTPEGRTPLGDKGLGRLGVQRLGENLEIFTKYKNQQGHHFGFSWLDFATAPTLQHVDIHLQNNTHLQNPGTKVVISGLHGIDTWQGQHEIKRLEQELSRMISPYKKIRDFTVLVEVDGKPLELVEISDRVRNIAPIRYSINFDGDKLSIYGRARLDFFRPERSEDAEQFDLIAQSDNGKAFFEFLQSQTLVNTLNLKRSSSKKWFVEFHREKWLDDFDKLEYDTSQEDDVSPNDKHEQDIFNPGPFTGEVDSFDLGRQSFQQQGVFDRISEYRQHIKELSGIRVYRDGFAIRVGHDWLKLGAQWTSSVSYYGLKPDNTLGYIALSARDNIDLEETTDREGFKDTPHYEVFWNCGHTKEQCIL